MREWQNGTEVRRAYDEHSVTRTLLWSEEEKEEEGKEEEEGLTSTFRYSRTGELKQVALPDGAALTINHDAAGRESERRGGRFLQTREYDAMGWLTREMSGQAHDGRLQAQQTREYRYDGAGNLTGVRTNRDSEGYRLDKTGRVLSVLTGGAGRAPTAETDYHYTRTGLPQEQGRLTEWEAGRLVQRDDMYYTYDRAGRLVRRQQVKPGFRAQVWHYRWDSRNQLRAVDTPSGETWFYRYDPFGRRVSKRCAERGEEVRYLWDGDQIAEVRHYRQGQQTSRRHWVYNGWELVVQQRHTATGGWDTDFVSSAQNGAPQALYDSEGELRWQAPKATLWGLRAVAKTESADPGLAFAGQLRDSESGLCYNRFRYYDPTGGGYISPDPIGLLGGENNYGYVQNPMCWVDPLGLSKCKPDFYVGPAGPSATMPATAYRHMKYMELDGSINKFVPSTLENKAAPVTYFGFDKYSSGSAARDGFQIAPAWSDARMRGTFDTLQLYKNGKPTAFVPKWDGNTHPTKLEPFASAYPEYGSGGAVQLHAGGQIINFDSIKILPD